MTTAFPDPIRIPVPAATISRSVVAPAIFRQNVFVLGQRFDFVTFDPSDGVPTRGAVDERGTPVTLQSLANSRSAIDMFGAGYYEMLSRQITADLQSIRNSLSPGQRTTLRSICISFGFLARNIDGSWDTTGVEGLPPQSLASSDAQHSYSAVSPSCEHGFIARVYK